MTKQEQHTIKLAIFAETEGMELQGEAVSHLEFTAKLMQGRLSFQEVLGRRDIMAINEGETLETLKTRFVWSGMFAWHCVVFHFANGEAILGAIRSIVKDGEPVQQAQFAKLSRPEWNFQNR